MGVSAELMPAVCFVTLLAAAVKSVVGKFANALQLMARLRAVTKVFNFMGDSNWLINYAFYWAVLLRCHGMVITLMLGVETSFFTDDAINKLATFRLQYRCELKYTI